MSIAYNGIVVRLWLVVCAGMVRVSIVTVHAVDVFLQHEKRGRGVRVSRGRGGGGIGGGKENQRGAVERAGERSPEWGGEAGRRERGGEESRGGARKDETGRERGGK